MRRDTTDELRLNIRDLYAVYTVPEDVNLGEGWPAGEYGIIFLNAEQIPATLTVFVTDGKLVRVSYHMGRTPEEVLAEVSDRVIYTPDIQP